MLKKFPKIQGVAPKLIIFLLVLLSAILSLFYFFVGRHQGIAVDSEPWGQFGDFFGGVLNPIISLVNMYLLYRFFRLESEERDKILKDERDKHDLILAEEKKRHHEVLRNSVLPWGDIHLSLNGMIEVVFVNHGNGPLIIDEIKITQDGGSELESFFKLLELAPYNQKPEAIKIRSYQLPKGDSTTLSRDVPFYLLQLTSDDLRTDLSIKSHFNTYLYLLSEMEISISYHDIYNTHETRKWSLSQWKSMGGYFYNI